MDWNADVSDKLSDTKKIKVQTHFYILKCQKDTLANS